VLPGFAYHFGIRPWEVELLTFDEIDELIRQLRRIAKG
jgi:hypothetical protein